MGGGTETDYKQQNEDYKQGNGKRLFFGISPFHNISLPNPTLLSMEVLTNTSPLLKHLFSKMTVPVCSVPERLKHFLPAWRLLTKDQSVLFLVEGFKIPLLQESKHIRVPFPLFWTRPSTKIFYQDITGSNVAAKACDDSGKNIPG